MTKRVNKVRASEGGREKKSRMSDTVYPFERENAPSHPPTLPPSTYLTLLDILETLETV